MVREWIVFFTDGDTDRRDWWDVFTRPGFRHVLAVGWDADLRVFVFFNPGRERSAVVLETWGEEGGWLAAILERASHAVRFRPRDERTMTPPLFGCVGAIKGLLGVRAPRALAPYALWKHLLANGGEAVDLPEVCGASVVRAEASEGGSSDCASAAA